MNMNMVMPDLTTDIGLRPGTGPAGTPPADGTAKTEQFAGLLFGRLDDLQDGLEDLEAKASLVPGLWLVTGTPEASLEQSSQGPPAGGVRTGDVIRPLQMSSNPSEETAATDPALAPWPGSPPLEDLSVLKPVGIKRMQQQAPFPPVVADRTASFPRPQQVEAELVLSEPMLGEPSRTKRLGVEHPHSRQQTSPLSEQRFEKLLHSDQAKTPATPMSDALQCPTKEGEITGRIRMALHQSNHGTVDLSKEQPGQTDSAAPMVQPLDNLMGPPLRTPPPGTMHPTASHGVPSSPAGIHDQVVVEQITSHFDRHGTFESGRARLKLYPEELGEIHLDIQVDKGQLAARLQAETPEVRDILNRQIDHLRHALEHQGLRVSKLEVAVVSDSSRTDSGTSHGGGEGHQAFDGFRNGSQFHQQDQGQRNSAADSFGRHLPGHLMSDSHTDTAGDWVHRGTEISATSVSLRV